MLFFIWLAAIADLYSQETFLTTESIYNVTYKEATGEKVQLDLFLPPDRSEPVPAVIFLHGGAWSLNSRRDYRDFARGMAQAGVAGITPDFRGTPPDGFQGQIDDVKDAIRWVRAHADEYGIDPDQIGIFGSSSGGHLAALAGLAGDGEGLSDDPPGESSALQAAFYLFGVYDLENSPILTIAGLLNPNVPPFGLTPEGVTRYSPLTYANGNEPPTYMMHGSKDFMVPLAEATRLRDAMVAAEVPVTFHVVEGLGHGFIKTRPWLRPLIFTAVRGFFLQTLNAE